MLFFSLLAILQISLFLSCIEFLSPLPLSRELAVESHVMSYHVTLHDMCHVRCHVTFLFDILSYICRYILPSFPVISPSFLPPFFVRRVGHSFFLHVDVFFHSFDKKKYFSSNLVTASLWTFLYHGVKGRKLLEAKSQIGANHWLNLK